MAQIKADRVKETTTTTGTGNLTLDGAVAGYRAFSSVMANGDTCYYAIALVNGTDWETGYGTLNSPTEFNRSFVKASSNSNTLVDFASGPKEIALTLTASELSQTLEVPHGVSNRIGFDENGTIKTIVGQNFNTIFGEQSFKNSIVKVGTGFLGSFNTAFGAYSLSNLAESSNAGLVSYNTCVGYLSGGHTSGRYNTCIGAYSSFQETGTSSSFGYATYVGTNAGYRSTSNRGTYIGYSAGSGTTGIDNTVVGNSAGGALYQITSTWDTSTILGAYAARSLANGRGNVIVGYLSLNISTNQINLTDGILIGRETRTLTSNGSETNTIVIGSGTIGNGSNTTTIGNSSTTDTYLFGNVIPTGGFKPASISDSSAPSNAIYFSTTAGKLVYKDASGTVNNLY